MNIQDGRPRVQTTAQDAKACAAAGYVMRGRLARIQDQNILFSPSKQMLFALNDTASEIWRCLENGLSLEAISSEIASRGGVDRQQAFEHVHAAVRQWECQDLIGLSSAWLTTSSRGRVSKVVSVSGCRIRIVYPTAHALPAATVFEHLETREGVADAVLNLIEWRNRIHLFRYQNWICSCAPDELAVVLKGQLLTEVLDKAAYEIAVHAAALIRDERILLLCGSPGAGKTTLALGLLHAGFGFAGDDVTLLNSHGYGMGIPFAPAVKAGALPILAKYWPDLYAAPICRRPDRRRVRFLLPKEFVSASSRQVGWVVLLCRRADSKAVLTEVDPIEALRGLLKGAFAACGELTGTSFDTLIKLIGLAKVYRLSYSRLEDAVALMQKACR